jgi:hypothetical protein
MGNLVQKNLFTLINGFFKSRIAGIKSWQLLIMFLNVAHLSHPTLSFSLTHLSRVRPALSQTCLRHAPRLPPYPPNSLYKYRPQNITAIGSTKMEQIVDAENLRSHFLQVLCSRRSTEGENQNPWMTIFFWGILIIIFLISSVISGACETCG